MSKKNEPIEPKERFYNEAKVALIKSTIFWSSAKEESDRQDFIASAISIYYSLFHLSLFLMWVVPDDLPKDMQESLIATRISGSELPNREISHKKIGEFLKEQCKLPVKSLYDLFTQAQKYREFVNYGPRITFKEKQALLGPCRFNTRELLVMLRKSEKLIKKIFMVALSKTAYNGVFGKMVLIESIPMIDQKDLCFNKWSSQIILKRAKSLLSDIKKTI